MRTLLGTLGLAGVLVGTGSCTKRTPAEPRCVLECGHPPTSNLDGSGRKVSHLLLGALLPEAREYPPAVFYVYLILAVPDDRNPVFSRAAARAVQNLFTDVVDRRTLKTKSAPAIFYVPMRDRASARALAGHDVNAFLSGYDYDAASALVDRYEEVTGQEFEYDFALIGSARPLRSDEPLDLEQLYPISLMHQPHEIQSRIGGFKDILLDSTTSVEDTEVNAKKRSIDYMTRMAEADGAAALP